MSSHNFTVNVPNPTAKTVSVQLRLEPGKAGDLPAFPREQRRGALKVLGARLALDPCAESGKSNLKLKLAPYESVDVYAIVDTGPPTKPGATGFHLIDTRNGKDVGGVFLVCVDPPLADVAGQVIGTKNPCPATLATALYPVPSDDDPSKIPATPAIQPGDAADLVAAVTNRTRKTLTGVQVYLEHLGASNATFVPGLWNVGVLQRGEIFYATWRVQTSTWQSGSFRASVVVGADSFDSVRLDGDVVIAPRKPRSSKPPARR
jgi:hypothetical protein